MKKTYILLLFSIFLSNAFAQVTLNYTNNGLLPGNPSVTTEIVFIDPGNTGENQLWDFSGIQYTGKTTVSSITGDESLKMQGTNEKNVILSEDGYAYNYLSSETGYKEKGYVNSGKQLTLNYTEPVIRIQYPFSYGQHFSNPFAGVAMFNDNNRIDVTGAYTVSADASGTLILPDRILKNTLRVKTSKQFLQTGMCGSIQSNLVKYCWFAAGYRYPVLTLCVTENIYSGKDPVIVKNGWLNLDQHSTDALTVGVDPKTQGETGENSVIVFPNPFTEKVTYNYFLRKQVPVMVELFDMSGKFNLRIEQKQLQPEGLHSGILDASVLGLPPGVYYLRFMFDKQVLVSKIVKI